MRVRQLLLLLAATLVAPWSARAAPLDTLDQPQAGARERSSGAFVELAPGATLDLLRADGPGRVVRLWLTWQQDRGVAGRSLSLRMWWDGAADPAVVAPATDFFGLGHGEGGDLLSTPVVARGRSLAAYWPMPFARGARIALTNDGARPVRVYYQVDWDRLAAEEVSPLRFMAAWRREPRTAPGTPFVVADLRGDGHLVGAALFVRPLEPGWWGEGDDRIEVDGRVLQGTGTEDWIDEAWGPTASTGPTTGLVDQSGRRVSLYRWYLADPVVFHRSLRLTLDQRGRDDHVRRSDDVSGMAWWYQRPPLPTLAALPPPADRLTADPPPETWGEVGATVPVDLTAVYDTSRFAGNRCVARARHPLGGVDAGDRVVAGVGFDPGTGCGDGPSALDLDAGESVDLALPAGGRTLWLWLAGDGERGQPALSVDAGAGATVLAFGRHLDPWADPWPVPDGRMAPPEEQGTGLRAAYVTRVALPAGATRVRLVAAAGAHLTVYAASRGP